jgi:hypothetical protein
MKCISVAIITLAGAIVLAAGSLNRHDDTQIFICGVGLAMSALGLLVWVGALRRGEYFDHQLIGSVS